MNLFFRLIPHDQVEIVIKKPATIQIVRNRPDGFVCEHLNRRHLTGALFNQIHGIMLPDELQNWQEATQTSLAPELTQMK